MSRPTAPNWRETSISSADEQAAELAPVLLEAPTAIPGYRLERVLERRPGLWTVYRATEVAVRRPVALTILGAQLNHDHAYGKRLLQDMRLLTELEHPNLVAVLAAGRAERGLFVASELTDLMTLEATLGLGVLKPDDLIRLFEPVADLLDRAHAQDLVHGGLSPVSIVMAQGGRACLTGFGLADAVAVARCSDRGMLAYMAPEQVSGGRPSARTDVYSLAATMLRCLTGVDSAPSRMPRRLSVAGEGRAGVQQLEVESVLTRALADAPGQRPTSAGLLVEEVRTAVLGREAEPAHEPATAVTRQPAAFTTSDTSRPARVAQPRVAPHGRRAGRAEPRGRRRLVMLIGASVIAVAGTAFAALSSTTGDTTAQRTGGATASTDRLTLTRPSGWSLSKRPAAVPGLPLEQTVALASRRSGGPADGVLTAGFVTDVDARLLPAGIDAQLATTPRREKVRIGRYEGYRYAGLQMRGSGRRLDLYVVPTTGGAATVACQADTGSGPFLRRCESIATTLVLKGVTAEPVEPSPEYIAALSGTINDLNADSEEARLGLVRAQTAVQQARLASELAQTYETAASRQAEASRHLSTARFNDQFVQALSDVRDAYRALAVASSRPTSMRYEARRLAVLERERAVRELLANFNDS